MAICSHISYIDIHLHKIKKLSTDLYLATSSTVLKHGLAGIMGNKGSRHKESDIDNVDDFQECSEITVTESESQGDQQIRRRSTSFVNRTLSAVYEKYPDVFLNFSQLRMVDKLSDDFHANVYHGYYGDVDQKEVLIKIPFNHHFTIPMVKKLAKNCCHLFKLNHENIVKLYGFAYSAEQIFVVSEFCTGGRLLPVLQQSSYLISLQRLGIWATEIAKGLEYLARNKVVHGNVCAAVCLMTTYDIPQAIIKVTDFIHPAEVGLSDYAFVPLRWVAPERIETGGGNTSRSADVWSFGIVLWELFSGGKQPYPKISSNLVLQEYMEAGGVHERPDQMPQEMYDKVMAPCLSHNANKRPSFEQIVANLENLTPLLSDEVREHLRTVTSGPVKRK